MVMTTNQRNSPLCTGTFHNPHVPQAVTPFSVATRKIYLTVLSSEVWMT